MKRRKSPWASALQSLLMPVAALALLLCFTIAIGNMEDGRNAESLRQLEEAIHRSCIACYATEGIYPPDIAYLQDRYGLQVDEEHYIVHYEIFAPNMMPDVTVLEK
ncbi:MAG: hypothetical protein HFF04_01240 [Oscillospiraceae bacterium]|nr:hypothetical protein [Oscillospiraceae bacterium]